MMLQGIDLLLHDPRKFCVALLDITGLALKKRFRIYLPLWMQGHQVHWITIRCHKPFMLFFEGFACQHQD
jgi:hypothetical protein